MRKTTLIVTGYYAFIFMALGAFASYISLYYVHLQLTTADITWLTTMGSVVAILLQPVWGTVGDRARTKNQILLMALAGAGLAVWLFPLAAQSLWMLMLAVVVFYAFQCAVNPLSDTIALEQSAKGLFQFSRVRMAGSVGYAIMAAVAGWLFSRNIELMFPLFSVFMIGAWVLAFFVPKVEGHQRGKPKVNPLIMLRNRNLVVIYAYSFIISTTLGYFYAFQSVYSFEQGISMGWIGLGIMIGCVLEPLFILLFNRMYQGAGIRSVLLLVGMIAVLRWILFAVGVNQVTYLVIWALHGGTYIILYLALAEFVAKHVPAELRAGGQTMNAVVMGASRVAGSLFGGLYAAAYSLQSAFMVCAVICAAALLVLYKWGKINKEQPAIGIHGDS
ncbi:MFS transporter [Paenibacillus sp. GD4]|jgi:MFS transporter, PPP family, 3-phenylpropionic acid transporter|uniref:MFS transporter n=1 Tax=Paenibacillus sp. GD4 TaxID=3068890 RepID=UPI0027967187|nr:MFS transporter [Paenibacillus sp. GD4]MDQ1913422.1 MFS transporter [Paenibacillus sp. GD4]